MDRFMKKQEYVSVLADNGDSEGGQRSSIRKQRSRNYKPPAIRVPSLLLFGTILAICIVLIEVVLRRATKSLDSNVEEPAKTTGAELKALPRHEKRADYACSQLPELIASQTSLEAPFPSLCSVFSQSYPNGKRLMPAQVTSFQQWMGSYSQQYKSFEAATHARLLASSDCEESGVTKTISYDPADRSLMHYWGCSSTFAYSGCTAYPTITLSPNNSVVAPPFAPVCGISTSRMLSLTTTRSYVILSTSLLTLTSQYSPAEPTVASSVTVPMLTITSQPISDYKANSEELPTVTYSDIATERLLSLTSQSPADFSTGNIQSSRLLTLTYEDPDPTVVATIADSSLLSLFYQSSGTTVVDRPSNGAFSTLTSQPPDVTRTLSIVTSRLLSLTSESPTTETSTAQQIPTVTVSSAAANSQSSQSPQSSSNGFVAFGSQSSESSQPPSATDSAANSQSFSRKPSELLILSSAVGGTSGSGSQTLYTVATTYTSLVGTTDKDGHTTSISAVVVQSTVVTTKPSPSATVKPQVTWNGNATSTATDSPIATLSSQEKIMDRNFDIFSYVAAFFLPPIIAVVIKVVWEVIYASFKMIEPFHRLSKTGGVTAERSLFAQYLSTSISLDAITSCFGGQALSMFTTFIYAAVRILAALAASSMSVRATARCEVRPNEYMFCNPVWVVNTTIMRSIEAILVACLALVLSIIVFTWNYRTGVSSNPSSIASVASLINQDALVYDFRTVDPMADDSQLAAALKTRQCALGQHASSTGAYTYGIGRILAPPVHTTVPQSQPSGSLMRRWFGGYEAVSNPTYISHDAQESSSLLSRNTEGILLDVAQFISSAGLLAVVTAFYIDPNDDSFNRFFNSGTPWARLVIVGIASIVDIQWKRLEREVRFTEPYRRMARSLEKPETTVLMDLNGTCWSKLPGSIADMLRFRRMWYQTLVSLVAVLSDFNIIAVANVVYSGGLIAPLYHASTYFVMAVTGLMIVIMLITMLWWRKGVVSRMPRTPDTIGGVFSYLCASRFALKMGSAQVEDMTPQQLDDMVIATRWRFSFKWKIGLDGKERWCVDYEDIAPVFEIQQRY